MIDVPMDTYLRTHKDRSNNIKMFSELSPEINYQRVVDGRAHWRHSLLKKLQKYFNLSA